jgi:four helix bundle protein
MDKTAEELKARTKRFAIAVLDFVDTLPRTPSGDAVARQLARAGLGIAGNYRGACRGRSHAEFTAKLGIVLEEADESNPSTLLQSCNVNFLQLLESPCAAQRRGHPAVDHPARD